MPKPAKTLPADTAASTPVTTSATAPVDPSTGGASVKTGKPAKGEKPAKATKAVKVTATAPLRTRAKPSVEAAPAPSADKAVPKTKTGVKESSKSQPKEKLVRDSFTMPQADFALIAQLKERALRFQRPTKKSELLRAGLQALAAMNDEVLQALLTQLPQIKTGRPSKTSVA